MSFLVYIVFISVGLSCRVVTVLLYYVQAIVVLCKHATVIGPVRNCGDEAVCIETLLDYRFLVDAYLRPDADC